MFRNYLKIAWRNLWKNKVYSIINIAGLATGMAASIVILLFVFYENSFDRFHTKNLYRLNEVQKFPGMVTSQKVALSMFPMGPTLRQEFPEIRNYCRVRWSRKYELSLGDKHLFLPQILLVDTSFLQMFNFPLLRGDPATALLQPNSAVLTETTARKLFGADDPMGKTIRHAYDDTTLYTVKGVVADPPENSHIQFDALFSFNTFFRKEMMQNWGGNWLHTFLELSPHTNPAALEAKFPAYLKKYMERGEGWKYYDLFLLPLRDVHAGTSDFAIDRLNYMKFDRSYTRVFLAIALIVLLIACVNFMNLSTARSAERAREVGIRKAIGALRLQLGAQFLSEALLLALLALILAAGLVAAAIPWVNSLSSRHLQLVFFQSGWIVGAILAATVLLGILSGLYPAIYLSSFRPVRVLKGLPQMGKNKGMLRNLLVVGQFTSAIFLIVATIFVYRQLNYMQDKDPGFVREQLVNIKLDDVTGQKFDVLKKELSNSTLITGVTAAQDQLGSSLDQSGVNFRGDGPERNLAVTLLVVDPDYLRVYKIPVIYGNNFSHEKSAAGREYIINEELARELLKDEPKHSMPWLIGRTFGFDTTGSIVGIAKDFNFNSLHNKIETMFFLNQANQGLNTMSVRIDGARTNQAIAYLEAVWNRLFPGQPFEYQFLDDRFRDVYRADQQVTTMVSVLAVLAIFISCLGLFGLASYSAEKRVKEIGIRKVMGASIRQIVGLLSRQFVGLVLLANLIALPLAGFAIHRWLEDYAYRIAISWWVFALAGILALVIALATVSILAFRAAIANPVNSLRSE
ncbi:MAG TPA: ABC transporter permease [Puia sp.]|nr:ABC transporter permease [Puia sp.]